MWMNVRLTLISNFMFLCIVLCFSLGVIFDMQIDCNSIAMTLTYSLLLSERFEELLFFFCYTEKNMISVERCLQYFDNEQEDLNQVPQNNLNLMNLKAKDSELGQSSEYSIEFKNVHITYDQVPSNIPL